jgi:cell division protein FtsQ
MKKKVKIAPLCIILLLVVLIVAANIWRSRSQVRNIRVDIDYCGADTLVTPQQVADLITERLPDLTTKRLCDVDLGEVACTAVASPWLRRCEAGTSVGGAVVVHAVQCRPVVRICSYGGEYYLDDRGIRVPVSNIGSADVVVASGNIPPKGKGLRQVWLLAKYFDEHERIAPLFDQIYRDDKGDLYLTPKLGKHVVQVGAPDDLDNKFRNLLAFYVRGLPQTGWETYSQISVKYKGQVVGKRR